MTKLEEGKKSFYYGDNPNSITAWLREDKSKAESEKVTLSDEYGSFQWHIEKSNKNVISESSTGSGEGKGFSFYFARYAYKDQDLYEDVSLATGKNSYSGNLARVNLSIFEKYHKGQSIPARLISKHSLLLIIEEKKGLINTIISATFTEKEEHLDLYAINASQKDEERRNKSLREAGLSEELIKQYNGNMDDRIQAKTIEAIKDDIRKGTTEFKEFLKSVKD